MFSMFSWYQARSNGLRLKKKRKGGFEFRHWWSFCSGWDATSCLIDLRRLLENLMTLLLEVPPSTLGCYSQPMRYKAAKQPHPSQKPPTLTRCERVHHQPVGGSDQLCWGLGLGPFPSLQFYGLPRERAKNSVVSMRYMNFAGIRMWIGDVFLNKEWNHHFQNIWYYTIALATM